MFLLWKWGFIWSEKSVFYCKKGDHFGLKTQCFSAKKGLFWAEKSVFCSKKGGNFQTGEQGWVPLFPVSEWAGGIYMSLVCRIFHNHYIKEANFLFIMVDGQVGLLDEDCWVFTLITYSSFAAVGYHIISIIK